MENRQFSRIRFNTPGYLDKDGRRVELEIIDISLHGVLARLKHADIDRDTLSVDDEIDLKIPLLEGSLTISMKVNVRHRQDEQVGFRNFVQYIIRLQAVGEPHAPVVDKRRQGKLRLRKLGTVTDNNELERNLLLMKQICHQERQPKALEEEVALMQRNQPQHQWQLQLYIWA